MRLASVVLVVLCGLVACSGNGTEAVGTGTSPSTTVADCAPTSGEPAQGSPVAGVADGPSIKLGPSSEITAAEAAKEAPYRQGTPLILTGTVYEADCQTPAAGAVINAWQTDARGVYGPGHGSDNLRCCYLQGTLETDAAGSYTIETIKPERYRGESDPPPRHIHLEVLYRGGGLLTEVLFAEEVDEGITLREESGPDGKRLLGRFDIVLPEE